jgi:pimeloyl-ACP methyl ester carboxylesterase
MLSLPLTTSIQVTQSLMTETYDELSLFQFDKSRSTLREQYTNDESEFVEVDDVTIHYREEGDPDGETLLLLHGTYSSLHTWDGWVDELADEFHVVRLDMPGFGLTGPRSGGEHTLEYLIETVGAFCDELGLTDVTVAGNSLGGGIAWRLSLDRPELVDRLILLDAGGATLLSKMGRGFTPGGSDFLPRYLTPRLVVRLILKDAYGDTSLVTTELVRRYHDLVLGAGNRGAVIEIARNYREDHIEDSESLFGLKTPTLPSNHDHDLSPNVRDDYDISDVSVPALFLWGTEDEWLTVSFGRQLAERTPESTFVAYDGVGHIPMEEAPHTTATDARQFLLATNPLTA